MARKKKYYRRVQVPADVANGIADTIANEYSDWICAADYVVPLWWSLRQKPGVIKAGNLTFQGEDPVLVGGSPRQSQGNICDEKWQLGGGWAGVSAPPR